MQVQQVLSYKSPLTRLSPQLLLLFFLGVVARNIAAGLPQCQRIPRSAIRHSSRASLSMLKQGTNRTFVLRAHIVVWIPISGRRRQNAVSASPKKKLRMT